MPPKRKTTRGAKKEEVPVNIEEENKTDVVSSDDSDSPPKIYSEDAVESASSSDRVADQESDITASSSDPTERNIETVKQETRTAPPEGQPQIPAEHSSQQPYPYPYPYPYNPQYPPGTSDTQFSPQQHQQQHQQHPTQYPYYPPVPVYDPDQEYYMQYYSQQASLSTPTPGMSYESRRSQNQMSHYFDTSKYPVNQPVPMMPMQGQAPKKVTKKDIERFKKRKEEKKMLKNKWLFE